MDQDQVNPAFDRYVAARTPLTVTLHNGTRLSGRLKKYDAYLLLVSQPPGDRTVLIYRHAVSSILARGRVRPPRRLSPGCPRRRSRHRPFGARRAGSGPRPLVRPGRPPLSRRPERKPRRSRQRP